MEEYENLKRYPDQRHLNTHRLQQQQLSSATIQLPQLQKMYLDLFRSMSTEEQQAIDYSKMLQVAVELGLGQYFSDAPKQSTSN